MPLAVQHRHCEDAGAMIVQGVSRCVTQEQALGYVLRRLTTVEKGTLARERYRPKSGGPHNDARRLAAATDNDGGTC